MYLELTRHVNYADEYGRSNYYCQHLRGNCEQLNVPRHLGSLLS